MNVNKVLTEDYENKTLGERGKNKPKTNPKQTQTKPNQTQSNRRSRGDPISNQNPRFVRLWELVSAKNL